MRILRIRFKNLNSLAGEWEIDLTHPAYDSDGIFAVTGPTGAGKTTILDAVCLALYGRTPRLDKVVKSANEIMSRRTGECFAEVLFRTGEEVRLCRWSQRRARKKAGGELQPPSQELSLMEAGAGRILETSARGTAAGVKEAVGMDFEQFTRSVLLAQGGFAAFLQANPDQRAPLLERITGTAIYSRISMRVHELRSEENKKRDALLAGLEGMRLLSPEEEQRLRTDLELKSARDAELGLLAARKERDLAGIRERARLEKELEDIGRRKTELRNAREAFAPDQARLDASLRCLEHAAEYSALTALRAELEKERRALKSRLDALPAALAAAERDQERLRIAATRRDAAKEALLKARPFLRNVRELDLKIAEKSGPVRAEEAGVAEQSALLAVLRGELSRKTAELKKVRAGQTGAEAAEGRAGGDDPAEQKAGERDPAVLRRQVDLLQKQCQALNRALETADIPATSGRAVRELTARDTELRTRASELAIALERTTEELTALEKEEDDLNFRHSLQKTLESYEKARRGLRDGEACPLCGALEHPYARGNIPGPDETRRLLGAVRAKLKSAREAVTELKVRQAETDRDIARAAESRKEHTEKIEDAGRRMEAIRAELPPEMLPAASDPEPAAHLGRLLQENVQKLARVAADLEKAEASVALEQKIAGLELRIRHLSEQAGNAETELRKRLDRLRLLREERDGLARERKDLFGDKKTDTEEQHLEEEAENADGEAAAAGRKADAAGQNVAQLQKKIDDLKTSTAGRESTLQNLTASFSARLRASGFAGEEGYRAAVLPEDERRRLAGSSKKLADEQAALASAEREKAGLLAAAREKGLPPETAEDLEKDLAVLAGERAALQQETGAGMQRLRDDEEQRRQQQERLRALEAQKRECAGWDELHALIGSADGKKYRNFAQGLTFDVLIARADRHLRKMSDRYRLTREDKEILEPSVLDNWQGGELRSVRNLSGGESFIVSLALALGLSDMAGSKTPDSLFLDEGFGTLDEEALDIALNTLAGLRREGRLIGVISHVDALKERIGAQIRVIPQGWGRSRLEGPGCRGFGA
jgi:exonuclease SbcC